MADANDHDRLLDHSYDGIQEYDNPMPRWWLYIFWATILFSVFYLVYYHGRDGRDVVDEYNAEMLAFFEKQAQELLAAGPIDEAALLAVMDDPSKAAGGGQVFASKCVQCHGSRGEGNIGPNLTDDYWIHGGKLTDIYRTVYEGVPTKGMLAWKKQLGLGDILAVTAYVGTLRGSDPPNAKAPQGEPFEYDREAILAEDAAAETSADGEAEAEENEGGAGGEPAGDAQAS